MDNILYLLILGLATAINPIQIVAVIIVICSHEGRRKGIFYSIAWLFGFLLLGIIAYYAVVGKNTVGSIDSSTREAVFKIVVGIILMALAIWEYKRNPHSANPIALPNVFGAIEKITLVRAIGIGFFLSLSNFRGLFFSIIAWDHILSFWKSAQVQIFAYSFYVLIVSLGVVLPVLVYIIFGKQAAEFLDRVKVWLLAHTKLIVIVILFIFGIFLTLEGIYALLSVPTP